MSDEPIIDCTAPVPIRPRVAPNELPAPPERIVRELRASLRATEAYVRILIDRIELACASDPVQLDRIPADALLHLTAVADALQVGADRALAHVDPDVVGPARRIAELLRATVDGGSGAPDTRPPA